MATQRLPAEQRRKQILRSAIRVFASRGYHGATTKQIAAEAEIAEALIYRYFESKRALFIASVTMTSQRLVAGMKDIFAQHQDEPIGALTATLEFYTRMLERNQDLAKMVFMVSAELDDPAVRDVYLPYQEQALGVIEDAVRDWQERGIVRDDIVPSVAAWLIMGGFQVVTLMKHTGRLGKVDVRPAVELMGRLIRTDEELARSSA